MIWYARSRSVRVMNQFNIGLDWKFTLTHSMHRSRALNLIVERFHTNNTLIYSYWLLYNVAWYKHLNVFWFKVQFLSIALNSSRVVLSNINHRNKLQLIQTIWNAMLYSQHFTFHWKLLVNKVSENLEAVLLTCGWFCCNLQCKTHFNSSESRDLSECTRLQKDHCLQMP